MDRQACYNPAVQMNRVRFRFLPNIRPAEKTTDTKVVNLVWVQCDQYRCLAYVDANGKWKNFYTGKELRGRFNVIG